MRLNALIHSKYHLHLPLTYWWSIWQGTDMSTKTVHGHIVHRQKQSMAGAAGRTVSTGVPPTVFADGAALVRLVHGVHTFRLGTRRHCAQHFTIGFTATPLTRRHLRHKPMIRVTPPTVLTLKRRSFNFRFEDSQVFQE